jgi:dTDP-4-amino-4,6-dideoxygalactose transaminase
MANLAINGGPKYRKKPYPKWPPYDHREKNYLLAALKEQSWGGYPSPNKRAGEFADAFAKAHGAKYGICCSNGTVTLEIALRAAGITTGDEVIVPALTWTATGLTPVYINAVPVFADIDAQTYCIDPKDIEKKITKKTRAIICVHLGSNMCDMDAIMSIAKKNNLIVIEDCAHAHGGKWKGKGAGSIGHFGSFSFQSSKLMTSGEGGLITTSSREYMEKCQSLVNCGRKEKGYDSYKGNLLGWNYRITEFQAAVLQAQLEKLDEYTKRREANAKYLHELLKEIPGVSLLKRDKRMTVMPCYQYLFRYHEDQWNGLSRDRFVAALAAEGLGHVDGDFYIPLHQNPLFYAMTKDYPALKPRYGKGIFMNNRKVHTPVAEHVAYHESVWMHYSLLMGTKKDVEDIAGAIKKIRDNLGELVNADTGIKSRWKKK